MVSDGDTLQHTVWPPVGQLTSDGSLLRRAQLDPAGVVMWMRRKAGEARPAEVRDRVVAKWGFLLLRVEGYYRENPQFATHTTRLQVAPGAPLGIICTLHY